MSKLNEINKILQQFWAQKKIQDKKKVYKSFSNILTQKKASGLGPMRTVKAKKNLPLVHIRW